MEGKKGDFYADSHDRLCGNAGLGMLICIPDHAQKTFMSEFNWLQQLRNITPLHIAQL